MRKGCYLLIILIFFLLAATCSLFPVQAADSTPSADIKAKLEQLKAEIASKAAKLKAEINNKLQNKAYIGKLQNKADTTLTLASNTGSKMVTVNQDTVFENMSKTRTKLSLKTLQEQDYLVALGDIDESGVLTAKKVILLSEAPTQKKVFWGQVVSVSDNLLTIKTSDFKNIAISITPKTDLLKNPKQNDFVIITGILGKNEIIQASFVHILTQAAYIIPKYKLSTPSAIQSSPSAKPSSKPSKVY